MPETIKNSQVNPNPVSTLSEWDLKTRDFLIEKMRKAGLKVNTNWEEGQKVLNEHWFVRRQRAWHGSPYDFKRFDHSRIGTGEGNLSFGRGTYVSQDKAVGKHYADMLGQTPEYEVLHHGNPVNLNAKYDIADETHIARILYQFDGDFDKAYQWQKDSIEQFHAAGDYSMEEVARQIVDAMGQEIPSEWTMKEIPNRHLYEVEIPDEGFLKWNEAVDDGIAGEILRDLQWEVAEQQGLSDAEKREMVLKLKKEYEEAYITDGEDLYDLIKGQPGFDDQKASEFLAGYFKGIEYDTNFFDGGNKEGKKNFVIFQEEDITIKNHYKFFLDGNNEAYGFVDDENNIYIDTRIATEETPIHEYAHLWAEAIRQQNPKEWNHIKEMIQENPSLYQYSQEIKERYHHLKSEDDIMDEVLATMTGKQAHTMLKGLGDEPIEKINNAFWKETAHFLDIHFTYSSQIAGKILQDLVSEVNPVLEARKREQQKTEQIKSTTMNIGTFQKEKADIRFHQTETNQHTKQHRTMNEAEQRLVDVFNALTEDTSRRKNFEEIMKEILPNNGDKMVLGLGGGMEINFTYNHQAYTIIPDEIKNINGELHIGNEEMYVPLNKIPEPEKDFVDEIVKNMAYETLIAERIGEGNEIRFKEPLTIATDAENNEVALIDAIHVSGHQLRMEGRQEYEGEWLDLRNHSLMKDGFENLYHQITNMTISEKTEMEKLSGRLVELTNPDISLSFQQGREGTLLEQRQYEKLLQIENPKNLRQWAEETMTITNGGRGHQLDNIQRETNREYIEVAKEVANLNDVQLENLFIITYGPLEPEKITQKTDENLSLPLRSLIEKMNERMNDLRNEFVPDELKGKVETTVNIIPDESFPLPYQKISSFESYDKGLGIMLVNPQDIQQPATTVGELSEKDTRSLAQYLTSHHEEIKEMVKDQMEQHVEVARSQNERLPELFSQVSESAEKLLASKETSGQAQEGWEILSNLKDIREGVISEPEKIRETIIKDRSLLISDTALKLDEMTNGKYAMLSHLMAYTATDHTLSQIASLSRQKDCEQDIQENIKEQYQILTKERTNGCVIAVTLPETQKQEDVQAVEVNPNRDTRVHTGNGTVLCLWELSAEDQKRIADWAITGYREDQLQKAMMDNNQSSIVFQKPIAHIAEVTVETEKTKGMTYYTRNGTIYFPTDLNRQENDQILTKGLEIAKASKLRQDKDLVDDTVLQFEKNYSFQVQMPVKERNGQFKEYGMTITAIHVDAEKNRINVSVQQPGAKGIIQLGDLNRMNQLAVTDMALAMRREQLFIEQQLEDHSVTYKSKKGETVLRSEANGLRYNIPLTETEKKQLHEGKVTTADLAKEHFTKIAMEANRGKQQGRSM